MIKRLTSLSAIFALTGLVFSLASVPSALGTENNSAHWLAQTETSGNASEEMRSTGKLAIGQSGVYIFFFSGENTGIPQSAKTFISGVAPDLTQAEAEANVIQYHTVAAWDAWLRCREAREKVKDKQMKEEQANLVCAEASEKDALLAKTTAIAMLENPLSDHQEWEQMIYEADQKLLQAIENQQAAIEAGAVPLTAPETLTGVTFVEPVPVPTETSFDTTTRAPPAATPTGATSQSE